MQMSGGFRVNEDEAKQIHTIIDGRAHTEALFAICQVDLCTRSDGKCSRNT